jgi:hypothetical protein
MFYLIPYKEQNIVDNIHKQLCRHKLVVGFGYLLAIIRLKRG